MSGLILKEILTPSNQTGPADKAYRRAVEGIGHAVLGACLAIPFSGGDAFILSACIGLVYWIVKERGDIKRGGTLGDSLEDTAFVMLGSLYGSQWWPLFVLLAGGGVMALEAKGKSNDR